MQLLASITVWWRHAPLSPAVVVGSSNVVSETEGEDFLTVVSSSWHI